MLEIEETIRSADGWKEESSERCLRVRVSWRKLLGFNITSCYYGYLLTRAIRGAGVSWYAFDLTILIRRF